MTTSWHTQMDSNSADGQMSHTSTLTINKAWATNMLVVDAPIRLQFDFIA